MDAEIKTGLGMAASGEIGWSDYERGISLGYILGDIGRSLGEIASKVVSLEISIKEIKERINDMPTQAEFDAEIQKINEGLDRIQARIASEAEDLRNFMASLPPNVNTGAISTIAGRLEGIATDVGGIFTAPETETGGGGGGETGEGETGGGGTETPTPAAGTGASESGVGETISEGTSVTKNGGDADAGSAESGSVEDGGNA